MRALYLVVLITLCLPLQAGDPADLNTAIKMFRSPHAAMRAEGSKIANRELRKLLAPLLKAMEGPDPVGCREDEKGGRDAESNEVTQGVKLGSEGGGGFRDASDKSVERVKDHAGQNQTGRLVEVVGVSLLHALADPENRQDAAHAVAERDERRQEGDGTDGAGPSGSPEWPALTAFLR